MNPVDRAEQLIKRGGHVHLVGIGGIGMAGLAWLLRERDLHVSGCDLQDNRQVRWLSRHGISIEIGHDSSHATDAVDWLIRSSAVPCSNPEIQSAAELGLPVLRRGEVLPALMRDRICIAVCGTHGKTTTTSLIAQVLACGYCIGGELNGIEGVAKDGELMVVEADESDGTIAGYTPDFTVITNIEYDHMEHHASESAFIGCFEELIRHTKQRVYYRADDSISKRICADHAKCEPFYLPEVPFQLPLHGRHNQWNAAGAAAVCRRWKSEREIAEALRHVKPVRRRFETVLDAAGIRIITDYAHHPTEIAALIQTARELNPKRLLGIFQPHRYTRTRALGADFPPSLEGLDGLWLVPVYAASEEPLPGGTVGDLAGHFPASWNGRLVISPSLDQAWNDIAEQLRSGDLLLIIGAGDIEQLAERARALR